MSTLYECPYCGKLKTSANGTGSDVACCSEVGHATTRINTEHVYPPIPLRQFDWRATLGDYDGAPDAGHQPMGYGRTEEEAIADLQEQREEA